MPHVLSTKLPAFLHVFSLPDASPRPSQHVTEELQRELKRLALTPKFQINFRHISDLISEHVITCVFCVFKVKIGSGFFV